MTKKYSGSCKRSTQPGAYHSWRLQHVKIVAFSLTEAISADTSIREKCACCTKSAKHLWMLSWCCWQTSVSLISSLGSVSRHNRDHNDIASSSAGRLFPAVWTRARAHGRHGCRLNSLNGYPHLEHLECTLRNPAKAHHKKVRSS